MPPLSSKHLFRLVLDSIFTRLVILGLLSLPQMGAGQTNWRVLGNDSSAVDGTQISAWHDGVVIGGIAQGHLFGRKVLGGSDEWLAYYDSTLQRSWTYFVQSTDNVALTALTTTSNDWLFWAGQFSDSLYLGQGDTVLFAPRPTVVLACHYPDGRLSWARTLAASGLVQLQDLVADTAGILYATGGFQDTLWTNSSPPLITTARQAPFLMQLDPNGVVTWIQTATHCLDAQGTALALDETGDLYWAAHFNGHFAWQGLPDTLQAHWVYRDILLQRVNPQGQLLWSQHHTGPYDNACTQLAVYHDRLYAAGQFKGLLEWAPLRLQNAFQFHYASYLVQLDARSGSAQWTQQSTAIANSEILGLSLSEGHVALCGTFQDSFAWGGPVEYAQAGAEAFQLQLDTQGVIVSRQLGQGGGFDLWRGVAWDRIGALWTVGGFQDSLQWADTLSAVALGFSSGWLWRQAPTPNTVLATTAASNPPFSLVPVRLQPNPARDSVHIVLSDGTVLQSWQLYNLQGQLVAQGRSPVVRVAELNPGAYSLQMVTTKGLGVEKLVVGR